RHTRWPRDWSSDVCSSDLIPRADLIGYSMGGAVAMQCAIRHADKVRKVVVISSVFRRDGTVKEALDMFPKLTADAFKGSPIEVRSEERRVGKGRRSQRE